MEEDFKRKFKGDLTNTSTQPQTSQFVWAPCGGKRLPSFRMLKFLSKLSILDNNKKTLLPAPYDNWVLSESDVKAP